MQALYFVLFFITSILCHTTCDNHSIPIANVCTLLERFHEFGGQHMGSRSGMLMFRKHSANSLQCIDMDSSTIDDPVITSSSICDSTTAGPPIAETLSSGNCTNNLTAESLRPSTVVNSTGEIDAETDSPKSIVTFDEFTKEKLKQEQLKKEAAAAANVLPAASVPSPPGVVPVTNPSVVVPVAAARNYASKECGAKVLLSNPEAENTRAVLNDKERDEYMRNPCDKAEHKFIIVELCETIQIRSVELANFEMFSSGPRQVKLWTAERYPSVEWQLLGDINAQNTRSMQPFHFPNNGLYAKFIKIEMLSHHGSEHYCTLSVLQVFGISMVDEYEFEAQHEIGVVSGTGPPSVILEPPTTLQSISSETSESPIAEPLVVGEVHTELPTQIEPPPVDKPILNEVGAKSKKETEVSGPLLPDIVDSVVSGRIIKKIVDVVKDLVPEKKKSFADRSLWRPLAGRCQMCSLNYPLSSLLPNQTKICHVFFKTCQLFFQAKLPSRSSQSLSNQHNMKSSLRQLRHRRQAELHQRMHVYMTKKGIADKQLDVTEPLVMEGPLIREEEQSKISLASTVPPTALPIAPPMPTTSYISPAILEAQTQQTQPSMQNVPIPSNSHGEALPASSNGHKESVFMKLNKRIAALELNMSLSSEYLSELSRQYVAQRDEHFKHLEHTKKTAQLAVENAAVKLNESLTEKLLEIRKEIDTLSSWLSSMRVTASRLSVSRLTGWTGWTATMNEERQAEERSSSEHITDLHRYSADTDHIWTTEQVVYAVLAAQLSTFLVVSALSLCYRYFVGNRGIMTEAMIEEKVNEIIERRVAELTTSSLSSVRASGLPQSPKRKRRRKRKSRDAVSPPSWETASDGTLTSASGSTQTETSSEAESLSRNSHDRTLSSHRSSVTSVDLQKPLASKSRHSSSAMVSVEA